MPCTVCNQDNCVCSSRSSSSNTSLLDIDVSRGSRGNTVQLSEKPVPLSMMSWNIERLGDVGPLGHNQGKRPDDIIESIAKIIHEASPAICIVLEVFVKEGKGGDELKRILKSLNILGKKVGRHWKASFTREGTGGLSDKDGKERRGTEAYAILYQDAIGIEFVQGCWCKIYGDDEEFEETGKGRAYLRDAFEWQMKIRGGGSLFGGNGSDLPITIVSFHAPGPRADLQRQTKIKASIAKLFESYSDQKKFPNLFICADFNASEDADNLLAEKEERSVDYSFPGDLDYIRRLVQLVTKLFLLQLWTRNEKNQKTKGVDAQKKAIEGLLTDKRLSKVAVGNETVPLAELEEEAKAVEDWFATNRNSLDLTGAREAKKAAKDMLAEIMKSRVERKFGNEQFERDKQRFRLWKKALKAKSKKTFSAAYWELEKSEGELILDLYADPDDEIKSWMDVQRLLASAFEDEFEDQQAFLGSRNISTYIDKVVHHTAKQVQSMVVNVTNDSVEEGYETAFSVGVDTGFFESTSYDETLKTTRRKNILKTKFVEAVTSGADVSQDNRDLFGSVQYSNYDQILPRTDGVRIDNPVIVTVPVFECVLPPAKNKSKSTYSGCAYMGELKARNPHRLLVQVCETAKEYYTKNVPKKSTKTTSEQRSSQKNKVAWKAYSQIAGEHCCKRKCITVESLKYLALLQAYLARANSISDHEPVLLTANVFPGHPKK